MRAVERIEIIEYGDAVTIRVASLDEATLFATGLRKQSLRWQRQLGLPSHTRPFSARVEGSNVKIRARAVTGILPIGRYEIAVVPKYLKRARRDRDWEQVLAQMVAVASSSRFLLTGHLPTTPDHTTGFVELFAQAYLHALNDALEDGLPRQYQLERAWSPEVRGRVVVEDLYPRVLYAPHHVPIEYPTFAVDTPINRLLKWAALEFASLPIRMPTANRLAELAAQMVSVKAGIPSAIELDRLSLAPQYRRCKSALHLARWLAQEKQGRFGQGSGSIPGLLLHSDRVFEGFVTSAVRDAARSHGLRITRDRYVLARPCALENEIPTEPDLALFQKDKAIAVVDAKYKTWKRHPKASDIYQVLAGARILRCPQALLAYPSGSSRSTQHWNVEGEGNPTSVSAFFLPLLSLAQVDGYAHLVSELVRNLGDILLKTATD